MSPRTILLLAGLLCSSLLPSACGSCGEAPPPRPTLTVHLDELESMEVSVPELGERVLLRELLPPEYADQAEQSYGKAW